ncbi:hypothetical protein GFS60_07659 (plasmid) [Rhodococcus sp. WAY2]|nr:hypothetical protein GFS60_07659 [Rhodococcus sp. WAY2]
MLVRTVIGGRSRAPYLGGSTMTRLPGCGQCGRCGAPTEMFVKPRTSQTAAGVSRRVVSWSAAAA